MSEDNIIEISGKKYKYRCGFPKEGDLLFCRSNTGVSYVDNYRNGVYPPKYPEIILEPIREPGPWEPVNATYCTYCTYTGGKFGAYYTTDDCIIMEGRKLTQESSKRFLLDAVAQAKALGLID